MIGKIIRAICIRFLLNGQQRIRGLYRRLDAIAHPKFLRTGDTLC
jgi:hypothetical protein